MTTPTTVKVQLKLRQGTSSEWSAVNPILLAGELGRESNTGKIKIGNGSTAWNSLSYQPFGALITNDDISATAEIAVSKLADGAARQLLQTDAAGTGVEWTNNVDIPGTLDVTGAATFDAAVTVAGDLTVNGTTTTISTQNLLVEDKNIIIGDVASPTDVTADGGGITLKGATDKTINWIDATDAWTSSERFSVPAGTAGAPSLTFTGDTNTGIYSPGADQVAISTGGSGRLFVDASGRVSVGTSNAGGNPFCVQGGMLVRTDGNIIGVNDTADTTYWFRLSRNGSNLEVVNRQSGAIAFHTSDTERLRVTSAGLVGVGTSSPGATLHVNGGSASRTGYFVSTDASAYSPTSYSQYHRLYLQGGSATNAYNGIGFTNGSNSEGFIGFVQNASGYGDFVIQSFAGSYAEKLRVTSAGNVGVGTTSPARTLSVYSTSAIPVDIESSGNDNALRLITAGGSGQICGIQNSSGNLLFNVSGSERGRFDSSGRLGIGTSSPPSLCSIAGPGVTGTVGRLLQIYPSSATGAGSGSEIWLGWNPSNLNAGGGVTIGSVYTGSGTDVVFSTPVNASSSPSERMRIDSSGRVGIGTSSPAYPLDLGTSNDGRARQWFATTSFIGDQGDGTGFQVRALGAGTSGIKFANYANNVEYGRFDSSGRLGIGTTPAQQLHSYSSTGSTVAGSFETNQSESYITFKASGTSTLTSCRIGVSGENILFLNNGANERARIDSSGRLLVGTSSARSTAFLATSYQVLLERGDSAGLFVYGNSPNQLGSYLGFGKSRGTTAGSVTSVVSGDVLGSLGFEGADGTSSVLAARIDCQVDGTPAANAMPGRLVFSVTQDGSASPVERMRITQEGYIRFNTTGDPNTSGNNGAQIGFNGQNFWRSRTNSTSSYGQMAFYNPNGEVGSISTSGSSTAFNTSSDYRLKENVAAVTDGITRLQQLKPSRFNFIADPDKTVDGFIAHEVQTIVPEAITGEKDAVDDDGNPVYQGIDQSKLVPLLTAALQEAVAKIESLETRLTAAGI